MIDSPLDNKPRVVMPLLALALAANMFLFGVAYTNASFTQTERSVPDVFAPDNISRAFDNSLNTIAENLSWSVSTAVAEAKPQVVAFLGLDNYKFGMPRYTALQSNQSHSGAVLGASIENPEYTNAGSNEVATQYSHQYIVIQIK